MSWVSDIIPKDRRNRPGVEITPKYITIHDTGNSSKGAGAVAHGVYLRTNNTVITPPNVVSWHATVDDTNIVQHLPFDEMAYHTGSTVGNKTSVGIEICQNPDSNRAKAEATAACLVADLMQQYSIPLDKVVPHRRWIRTSCPAVLIHRWNMFIVSVAKHAGLITTDCLDLEKEITHLRKEAAIWERRACAVVSKLDDIRNFLEVEGA